MAWDLKAELTSETTRQLLIEASRSLPDGEATPEVQLVTDGGPENFGSVDDVLNDPESSYIRRIVARVDIVFSNSLIEAFWLQIKHSFLFMHKLDTLAAVRKLVEFYVQQHNEVVPRTILGDRTPDEVYFGREKDVRERLVSRRLEAPRARIATNRSVRCQRCAPALTVPKTEESRACRINDTIALE